jgi:hypothetical protein
VNVPMLSACCALAVSLSMMLELSSGGTMPPQCLSRMRPPFESPRPFALARDDGSGIASAWMPSGDDLEDRA